MLDLSLFKLIQKQKKLATFRVEELEGADVEGRILDVNEDFILLHRLAIDDIRFDGLTVLWVEDVTSISWDDPKLTSREWLLDDETQPYLKTSLLLESWHTVLEGLSKANAIVSVHRQHLDASAMMVGFVDRLFENSVVLQQLTPEGTVEGKLGLALEDITRVDAFGRYERSLNQIIQIRDMSRSN